MSTFAGGNIKGIAELALEDGSLASSEQIRVLLVMSNTDAPDVSDLDKMNKFKRMEYIRELHMTFFINVRKKMTHPDFVFDSTLTKSEGTFQFSNIPSGAYYILVTFPAMIEDFKVAWQVPAVVIDGETTFVKLNNKNLLIPTYSRR